MVQFSVATQALGFSAAAMTSAVAEFDAQIQQASAAVNAVAGATWTGTAADAFLADWTDFLVSATATRDALASIAVRLHSAQGTYEGNEGQLAASARSSRVNIQGPGVGTSTPAPASPELSTMPASATLDTAAPAESGAPIHDGGEGARA